MDFARQKGQPDRDKNVQSQGHGLALGAGFRRVITCI